MTTFYTTAGKPYTCHHCGAAIAPGDRYAKVRAGAGWRYRCMPCEDRHKHGLFTQTNQKGTA